MKKLFYCLSALKANGVNAKLRQSGVDSVIVTNAKGVI